MLVQWAGELIDILASRLFYLTTLSLPSHPPLSSSSFPHFPTCVSLNFFRNPTGVWIAELAEPYYAFKKAGYEITIASPAGGACPIDAGSMADGAFTEDSKKFLQDAEAYAKFR